jgi:hypothetical protein
MRNLVIATSLLLGACSFSGNVDPNVECTGNCDQDQQDCYDACDTTCSGDGDTDDCMTTCHQECDTTYDNCTVSCTSAD